MDVRSQADVERLYNRVGRAAIAKTMRLVGRLDLAEEIVQESFLKLWKSQPKFEDEKAAYGWIYRTCHNAGIDLLRSATHNREYRPDPEVLDQFAIHADMVEEIASRDAWVKAVQILDKKEAQILSYRVIDGLTQDEIAGLMGVSRKTVVRTCQRLETKLATKLMGER